MKTVPISEHSEMEAIINQCEICFVGITEEDGSPYVIPMNFGYFNGDIILHSGPTGKHLNLIAKDNRICVTFCSKGKIVYQHINVACSYRMDSKSVLCKGKVTFIEDISEKESVLNVFMKKYSDREFSYSLPALKNVKLWRVKVYSMTAKAFGQKHLK